jgi:anti-sigma B factor antagonist
VEPGEPPAGLADDVAGADLCDAFLQPARHDRVVGVHRQAARFAGLGRHPVDGYRRGATVSAEVLLLRGRGVTVAVVDRGSNDDATNALPDDVELLLTCCVVRHTDGSCRLVLAGEVDMSNKGEVGALFDEAFSAGGGLDVDLSGLTHVDSTMLTLLVMQSVRFEESDRSFRVVAASPIVRKVFRITGLRYLMQ